MSKYIFLFTILLSSCGVLPSYTPAPAFAAGMTPAPTQISTQTPIPSPTIGYQDTAVVAQQTAMEAVRVNAAITAEFEQRVQEQLQMTAQADVMYFQMQGWTQTAMPTAVMLTATQQAAVNTQIAGQQTIEAGRMTATAQAPTMIVAMANSQNKAKHAQTDYIINMIGISALAFFMLSAGILLLKKAVTMKQADFMQMDAKQNLPSLKIEYTIRDEKNSSQTRHGVLQIATLDNLLEMAEMVVNGERTFGYNRTETNHPNLNRDVVKEIRQMLENEKLAINTHNGESVLNDAGVSFFEYIFENHQLPEGFG